MRLRRCGVSLVFLWACTTGSNDAPADAPLLALVNVNVVDVESGSVRENQTVLLEGNRIHSVVAGDARTPSGATVIDARGKYVVPGLWDMHVHISMLGTESLPLFLAHGVTGIRDAGSTDSIYHWRTAVQRGELVGPRMVVSGRIIVESKEAHPWDFAHGVWTPEAAREAVRQRRQEGADYIKAQDSYMRRELWLAVADEAAAQGLTLVGHAPVDLGLAEAFARGLRGIEHTLGFPLAFTSREAELRRRVMAADGESARWSAGIQADVDAVASLDSAKLAEVATLMRQHGVVLDPNLTDSRAMGTLATGRWNNDPRLEFIRPAMLEQWRSNTTSYYSPANSANLARLYEQIPAVVRFLHKRGVTIVAGTDAGATYDFPGSDVHSELWHLVEAGLTPVEALRAATMNAAKVAGLDSVGSIKAGMLADLLILDANPLDDIRNTEKISAVVSDGRHYDRAALDALLDDVRRKVRPRS